MDDDVFIDALDYRFRDAKDIVSRMAQPCSPDEVVERMNEFTSFTPDIESAGERWRIALPDTGLSLGLHQGDCLKVMRDLRDQSVDLILADLPYGTCGGKSKSGRNIDIPLNLEALWAEYRRIIKPLGNIVLFGSQPFSTDLIIGCREWFKYNLVWQKDKATGFNHSRNKPMKDFEDILIFTPAYTTHARQAGQSGTTANRATYNPWRAREVVAVNNPNRNRNCSYQRNVKAYPGRHRYSALKDCPRMVLNYPVERERFHTYQKPVALLDDLIRMYSNPGELVLDNCAGSGSTAIAAEGAGRQWIAIEQDPHYYEVAKARIMGDGAVAA